MIDTLLSAVPGLASGLTGGNKSSSSSSSSSNVSLAFNPSIAISTGSGNAAPSTSGNASGSASSTGGTASEYPSLGYGDGSLPVSYNDSVGTYPAATTPVVASGASIFDDPIIWLALGAGALILMKQGV